MPRLLSFLLASTLSQISVCADDRGGWINFSEALKQYADGSDEVIEAFKLRQQEKTLENRELAIEMLERARAKGNPCAYLLLSPFEQNPANKVELIRYAYDHKISAAIYPLADALYQHGRGNEADYQEALELFIHAGQQTHKDAQFYAGRMYHFGHGTEKDFVAARDWYKRAVESGSVRAANNLANLWADGDGGEADLVKAMEYFQYASDKGMAMASYNLGNKYRTKVTNGPDYTNALKYYQMAIDQAKADKWNYAEANYWVGWIYLYGKGVDVDVDKARRLLEAAAEGEFERAYFTLGWFYDSGKGGVPDPRKANDYYQLAAASGHVQAMSNLAWNLWELNGDSAMPEALPYFLTAVEKGNTNAMTNFGYLNLYRKWPGADDNYGLKLSLEAAGKGSRQAMENLFYYYDGWGELSEPDVEKAAYWKEQMHRH